MVEQKKDVIYVPYWIAEAVQRNNWPLTTILDYRKMAQFLSPQEQANALLFEGLNPFSDQAGPQYGLAEIEVGTSITQAPFSTPLYDAWRSSVAGSENANDKRLLANLQTMYSATWNTLAKQEVAMRMDPVNAGHRPHPHPFTIYDVERECLFVVVQPAFFNDQQAQHVITLCKEVLKVLYVYNTPASGCKTPYFRKYLESLA